MIKKSIKLDAIIDDTESELEYKKKIFVLERSLGRAHQILKHGVGKTDKIPERLKMYIDAGVNQFFLTFQDPFDSRTSESFSNTFRG